MQSTIMRRADRRRGDVPTHWPAGWPARWQFFLGLAGALFVAALFAQRTCLADELELNDATFRRLHEELRPAADEAWRTIPWKIALLDAQQTAAREKKPIFIWAMDGHPLGCT